MKTENNALTHKMLRKVPSKRGNEQLGGRITRNKVFLLRKNKSNAYNLFSRNHLVLQPQGKKSFNS
jgi:hypothetical protein